MVLRRDATPLDSAYAVRVGTRPLGKAGLKEIEWTPVLLREAAKPEPKNTPHRHCWPESISAVQTHLRDEFPAISAASVRCGT